MTSRMVWGRTAGGAALAAALLSVSAAPAQDWPTFRGNSRRSGSADGAELARTLDVVWTFDGKGFASPRFNSSPALWRGKIYAGVAEHSVFSPGGRVVAIDAASGKLVWERKTRFPVFSSPAVTGSRVLIGEGYHQDSGCRLYCLDAELGQEKWTFETRSHIESSPHVEKDRVFFGAGADGLHSLRLEDGKPVWHFDGGHVDVSPMVVSGMVFAGTGYGELSAFCLDAEDGEVKWKTPMDLPVWGSPVVLGNRLYVGLGNGTFLESAEAPRGAVVCLAATSGKEVWRRDLPDAVLSAIVAAGDRIVTSCRDGHLYALDPRSGEVRWKRPLGGPIVASPLAGAREVGAVSIPGTLAIFSGETGEELARITLPGPPPDSGKQTAVYASPAAGGGRIYVSTGAGVLALGKK